MISRVRLSPRVVFALSMLVAVAASAGPRVGSAGLRDAFQRACAPVGCPAEVLWAVAVARTGGQSHAETSRDGTTGILGLVAGGRPSLDLGASLAGVPADRAAVDLDAQLRAGAALLALWHAQQPAGLAPEVAWVRASAGFAGSSEAIAEGRFVEQVIGIVQLGGRIRWDRPSAAEFAPVAIPVADALEPWAPLLAATAAEYPLASWNPAASCNYTSGRTGTIQYVVIHTMEGSYGGSISWFQNCAAGGSTHYLIRSSDGQSTQSVAEEDTAWQTGNSTYNREAVGIEHEGYVAAPATWYTETMYQSSAALTAYLCDKWNIPKDRQHIIGHDEVPNPKLSNCGNCDFGGCGCHDDPGPGWDWDHYMALVNGGVTPPVAVKLVGYVRENDIYTGAAIPTATVTLSNGAMTSPAASGLYTFASVPMALGTVTVTATAPGYLQNSKTVTLQAGVTNWASIALVPGCTPACGGKACGPDGCGGSCGSCDSTHVCQSGACVCSAQAYKACCQQDVCWYDSCGSVGSTVTTCQSGCAGGSCQDCTPACAGKACGDDGCGGSCGACTGGKVCDGGACSCLLQDHKACCGDSVCWYDSCGNLGVQVTTCTGGCSNGICGSCSSHDHQGCCGDSLCWFNACDAQEDVLQACPNGCVSGACASCVPECGLKVCGSDGCGGQCPDKCGAGFACDGTGCKATGDASQTPDAAAEASTGDVDAKTPVDIVIHPPEWQAEADASSTGGCSAGSGAGPGATFPFAALSIVLILGTWRRRAC